MKKLVIKQEEPPGVHDDRIKLAELISRSSDPGIIAIKELYPEYFSFIVDPGSLECKVEINSSYTKWITDYGITRDWIGEFPTLDIYYSYKSYCIENRLHSMDKTLFFSTLENDFYVSKNVKLC